SVIVILIRREHPPFADWVLRFVLLRRRQRRYVNMLQSETAAQCVHGGRRFLASNSTGRLDDQRAKPLELRSCAYLPVRPTRGCHCHAVMSLDREQDSLPA